MARHLLAKTKHYSTMPVNTLSVIAENINSYIANDTGKERKTEKSVRFVSESESQSNDESEADSVHSSTSNGDIITWVPSEHLYINDTFISESQTASDDCGTVVQTDTSYGTNTFIDFESEDETKTLSEYSYTDSFASSDIFSSHSQSYKSNSREWKDVTEIVKDIEELAESEFVNRLDLLQLATDQEETDITGSEDGETEEMSKQNFLLDSIRRLKLKELQSPRDLDQQFQMYNGGPQHILEPGGHKRADFYHKMIESCHKNEGSPAHVPDQDQEKKYHVLEYYGVSSDILEKLKTDNFQHWLKKKQADIENETDLSLEYIRNNQHINDLFQEQQFINHMRACVVKENMDDCIQTHLIKMHQMKWFSHFINELPKFDEDSREILYRYKKQVENRVQENG